MKVTLIFADMFNIALLKDECVEKLRKGLVFRSVFSVFHMVIKNTESMAEV